MPIETLEDIIESLADQLGVYGDEKDPTRRICFTSDLRARIERAVEIDRKLNA